MKLMKIGLILLLCLSSTLLIFPSNSSANIGFIITRMLPNKLILSKAGQAGLISATVGAGIYVGSNTEGITEGIADFGSNINTFWDSLSQSTKDKFIALEEQMMIATGDTEFTLDADVLAAINAFMAKSVIFDYANVTPVIPVSYITSGPISGSIHSAQHVDAYKVATGVWAGNEYAFIPIHVEYEGIFFSKVMYTWAKKLQNGTYEALNEVTVSPIQLGGFTIDATSSLPYLRVYYLDPLFGNPLQIWARVPTPISAGELDFHVKATITQAIATYMQYANVLSQGALAPAGWADALPAPQTGELTEGKKIAIPQGLVTVGQAANTTELTITAADAQVIADSIGAVSQPGTYDPPAGSIDWTPLLTLGNLFTTKFPFSIPWDVKRQLDVFNVQPQAPFFNINTGFSVGGVFQPIKFTIDLSSFDMVATFIRWIMTIAFDLAIILSIRRLMPE